MKKLFALLTAGLLAGVLFGQQNADEWFKKAGEYLDSGDFANAVQAYSEVIKRDSSNLNAYFFRGFAYYQVKKYDPAIADLDRVIKEAPDFPVAYVVRGDSYGAKGEYHKAAADFVKGLEKGSDPSGFTVDKSSKADMWFCGAIYKEIVVNRFLGKNDAANNYEKTLKTVCDKNAVTRAEVEAFYRNNIAALVSAAVDAEFNKISFLLENYSANTNFSYNAVLTRSSNPAGWTIYYERPSIQNDDKKLTAPTLEALLAAMPKSGDFVPAAVDTVRAQAALMPAAALSSRPLDEIKAIVSAFYTSPSTATYAALREVYALYTNARLNTGEAEYERIRLAYVSTLSSLNNDLARKVINEALNSRYTALSADQQRRLVTLQN